MKPRPPAGFTLLELMVALALFALVAIMSLQVLTGALHQRSLVERRTTEAASLFRMMTQLRSDLESVVPATFTSPIGDEEPAVLPSEDRLALSLGGQPRLSAADGANPVESGFQRVIWRHDDSSGTVTRQIWPVLHPRDPAQIGPEILMMEDVESWQVTPAEPAEGLPARISVTFESARHGFLRLVVAR